MGIGFGVDVWFGVHEGAIIGRTSTSPFSVFTILSFSIITLRFRLARLIVNSSTRRTTVSSISTTSSTLPFKIKVDSEVEREERRDDDDVTVSGLPAHMISFLWALSQICFRFSPTARRKRSVRPSLRQKVTFFSSFS